MSQHGNFGRRERGDARRENVMAHIKRIVTGSGTGCTQNLIAQCVGISAVSVFKHLRVLEREGHIVRRAASEHGKQRLIYLAEVAAL